MISGVVTDFGRPSRGSSSSLVRSRLNSKVRFEVEDYLYTSNNCFFAFKPFKTKNRITVHFVPCIKNTQTRQLQMACKQKIN